MALRPLATSDVKGVVPSEAVSEEEIKPRGLQGVNSALLKIPVECNHLNGPK